MSWNQYLLPESYIKYINYKYWKKKSRLKTIVLPTASNDIFFNVFLFQRKRITIPVSSSDLFIKTSQTFCIYIYTSEPATSKNVYN